MKKQLLFASAAVMLSASVWATHAALSASAPLSDATEVNYDLSSLGSRTANTGRYISEVVLSAGDETITVGPACSSGNAQLYFDLSDQAFSVLPGTEVSVTVNGEAIWMHTYAYVDWNKDGFNYSQPSDLIDLETFKPVEGSDLVWYNAWCPNSDESGNWGDSAGNIFSSAGNGNNKTIPCSFTFTVPEGTPAGDYRMRVKSAWQSLDPNGGVDASASTNTIQANGGNIVDFTLTVKASEPEDPRIAEIKAKIDEVRAVAEAYKANAPVCTAAVDELLGTLDSFKPSDMLGFYDQIDELIDQTILTPIKEAVVESLNTLIGKEISLYQHNQDAYLCATNMWTNQGWNSFNYQTTLDDNCAWTLVPAADNTFYLKSAKGQYVATPKEHYCQVVDQQTEAAPFAFSVLNGYVILMSQTLENCCLALDGQNDPAEMINISKDLNATLIGWKAVEYVSATSTYYIFESKRAAGTYLADHADAITTTNGSTTLYRQAEKNTNIVWAVTPGSAEGAYHVKNYITGKYLVNFVAYCDVTTDEPVDIYMVPTSDGGFSLSTDGVAENQSSIDANNFNECVGFWVPGDEGTTWFRSQIEVAEGQGMQEALDQYFANKPLVEAAATLEVFANILPGASSIVESAVAEVMALEVTDSLDAEVADIKARMLDDLSGLIDEIIYYGDLVTLTNTRRAGMDRDALLAVVDDNAINTIVDAETNALWYLEEADTDGAYYIQNAKTGLYIGLADGQPAMSEEATALTLSFRDNGTINFTQVDGAGLLNMNTYQGTLEFYGDADDTGSQWTIGACPVNYYMFSEQYPIVWDNVIVGNHSAYEPDNSNGKALTSFHITFDRDVTYTDLYDVYVIDDSYNYAAIISSDNISYNAETHTATFTIPEPLTEYGQLYYVWMPAATFSYIGEDGAIVYTPEVMSYFAECTYIPDVKMPLYVSPEGGVSEKVLEVSFWLGVETTTVNTHSESGVTITKDFADYMTITPDELSNYYNSDLGIFTVFANLVEEGVYTMTIPEGLLTCSDGRNELTTVTWDIDPNVGITNVTVNGEEATEVFDINGRRLAAPVKGINIINGKKTLIRK